MSARIHKTLVIADFLTDRQGVIAKQDEHQQFQIPAKIRNSSDWQLFQELMAQSDVIISSAAYFKRLEASGRIAQDILHQFERGSEFESLGAWRLKAGYPRSPDVAVVSRSLDLKIPEELLSGGRRIMIFTGHALANSDRAEEFAKQGVVVIDSGEKSVEGLRMTDYLSDVAGYHIVMLAAGPSVLQILLGANRLDLFYTTQAQVEIYFEDSSSVQKILPDGKQVDDLSGFRLTHEYLQENVITEDRSLISQLFLRYENRGPDKA